MRPRGRKPTPTPLRLLQGNPHHYPLSKNEPKPEQLVTVPDPPEFLDRYAVEEWRRAAPFLHNLRLLTDGDLKVLEAYCVSYGRWREAEEALARVRGRDPLMLGLLTDGKGGGMVESPLVRVARKERFEMLRYASEFGFSPSSRVRLGGSRGSSGNDVNDPFRGLIG